MSNGSQWVDPFLKGLFRREPGGGGAEERSFLPPTDIHETATGWVVLVDMPGVDEKGVELKLEDGVLFLTGRPAVETRSETTALLTERASGVYRRRLALGESAVDTDQIRAVMKNGVLRVTLPKASAARTHRIPVQSE